MVTFVKVLVINAPYWILGTDYENYSVGYSCGKISGSYEENLWVQTRISNPSPDVINAALNVVKSNNLNTDLLITIDQKNCSNVPA
ncbi:unnamed protein product [Diabrotica balteata]|uniref:Lipocalin/cytosolic fatty-acid binding domain-containing protein n=1 Tax=Diabrotica balteata TaxID=107213 RepID=A0A9N9XFY2_DIABA|nr:unnamed protein product [Diabrotica balteata]